MSRYPFTIGLFSLTAMISGLSSAQPPSNEEMWKIIQQQEQEIETLKSQSQETNSNIESTATALDEMQQTTSEKSSAVSIGGYGELHYNNLDNQLEGGADQDEIDFHRLVFFFGYEFNEDIRFVSEIEYEHADTGSNGAVEVEQAYVEFDLNESIRARGGLFLVPIGIMNETHEPPTFYGVERNPVENRIIPTTWWVGGASISGELAQGFSYDAALHEGLNTSVDDDYAIRAGRQKTSEAIASDLAMTGRIKWTGMPGVELAAAIQHQSDVAQSLDSTVDSATLFETHAVLNKGPLGLKALYAIWNIQGSGPEAIGADEQEGWYVEPSYKINDQVGLFTRYNEWDNLAGDSTDSKFTQIDVGINYWVHPDVVLKADYQDQDAPIDEDELDGFNLGIGYQF